MHTLFNRGRKFAKSIYTGKDRDPRYILVLLWAVPLFALMAVQALHAGWFDSVERPVFHYVNNLPHVLGPIMYIVTQLGSLGGLVLWFGLAWYLVNRRAGYTILAGGFVAWLAAKVAKAAVHRDRPTEMFHNVNLFQGHMYSGYGFPSGHSTFSAACATILFYQLKPRYRKYLLLIAFLVGLSRIYLGAHFPFDVVGGWALGAIVGSAIMLTVGSSAQFISARRVRRALMRKGYDIASVRFVNLDARGSRPLFIELGDGTQYFGKLFGKQEHAADWLFKLYRFFRYKNLQAEEPYINGRRNVELESFSTLWAKKAGARVPDVIDIVKIGEHWLLIQEKLDAKPLPDFKRLNQSTLEDAWHQVAKLHTGNMAHRDLRAANLMVDTSRKVWLIDFGFAEASPNKARKSMDVAELLMSMSLLVGVERTVDAAYKTLDRDELKHALPYLQKSVFSGATTQQLRSNKQLLAELQDELKQRLRVEGEVETVSIDRLNGKKLLNIGLLAVFAYVVLPQFTKFSGTLDSLDHVRLGWLVPVAVFSALTYVAAGLVYVALANIPLRLRDATMVQLAASFVSKIIPGGIGATSLNARYLTQSGLDSAEASALILGQNVIGVVMFIVPLMLFLLVAGGNVSDVMKFHVTSKIVYIVIAAILVLLVVLSLSRKLRTRAKEFAQKLITNLRDLSSSPRELAIAAAASFAISLCYVACLYASVHAFHATLSVAAVALIYASAMIAKAAVPTPGGLGPVEIAIAAGLTSAGLIQGQAFAIVILYRLATFWLPVPFSLLAYRYITQGSLFGAKRTVAFTEA